MERYKFFDCSRVQLKISSRAQKEREAFRENGYTWRINNKCVRCKKMREIEEERKRGKGRVLRTQKEGSSGPMRDCRDGGHFNDRDKQREEERGTEWLSSPLLSWGCILPVSTVTPSRRIMHTHVGVRRVLSTNHWPAFFLRERRTHGVPLRRSYLSPCKYVHVCVYISSVCTCTWTHTGCIVRNKNR